MKRFLFILFLSTTSAFAVDDQCSYFKYCGASSSSSRNSVNTSTAATINPSNIAKIKGLGFETLFQPSNPLGFSLVTGNGKIGGAFISSSLDNSFFGVRALEIDDVFYQRYVEHKRYKNNKINLALGLSLVSKPNFELAIGLSLKRNSEIKKINPGVGFSARLGIFTFGTYIFKDDVRIDLLSYTNPYNGIPYSTFYNSSIYQENYLVKTFTAGLKLQNFSFDAAFISTKYDFYQNDTKISIITVGLNFSKVMFNYAIRKEFSPNLDIKDNQLVINPDKTFNYFGIQFMATKNFMFGLGYNTFLLNEVSGTLTIFLN